MNLLTKKLWIVDFKAANDILDKVHVLKQIIHTHFIKSETILLNHESVNDSHVNESVVFTEHSNDL